VLKSIKIHIPDLREQKVISCLFKILDDKIELNNKINSILEQISQALFKHWFIDFEFPDEQGRPYKSSGGEFVDSELGKIPKGWQINKLGNIFDISWGDTNITKKSYIEKGYKAYSASGLDGYLDHYDYDCIGIVVSAIGAYSGQTWFANEKWSCIKNTIRAISDKSSENFIPYLYYMSKNKKLWPIRGSAQPFISQGDARNVIINLPPKSIIKKFSNITLPVLNYINKINEQSILLSEIRDLILPKLITGKIRVNLEDISEG
jgi:type I restriction enzyme S subunit